MVNTKSFLYSASALLGVVLLSLSSAWVSSGFRNLEGGHWFFGLLFIAAVIVFLMWRAIRSENPPTWLLALAIGGILLRFALGMFWFVALPEGGYDTPTQTAGFIMEDAFHRETAAWRLAQSDLPLTVSFQGYSAYDQFGGMLFLDAFTFRYFSSSTHIPQLTLVFASAASGLAVLFTWAFVKRLWGGEPAKLAAWIYALFPEAVLLGSTQMREAFTVLFFVAAIYFLLCYMDTRSRSDLVWLAGWLAASLLFSVPVFVGIVLVSLIVVAVQGSDWSWLKPKHFIWGLIGLGAAFVIVLNLVDVTEIPYLTEVNRQVEQAVVDSGWIERTFRGIPSWARLPFIVVYGVFRPLLPAALIATVNVPVLWRAITIWRALGWTVMLALMFYASFLVIRERFSKRLPSLLLAYNWLMILVVSYRGVGDNWDNPRYRVTFAGLQAGLVAWGLMQKRRNDKWLGRIVFASAAMVAWFIPWYLRRYIEFSWPVVDLWQTVGLGLVTAALYFLWDWSH